MGSTTHTQSISISKAPNGKLNFIITDAFGAGRPFIFKTMAQIMRVCNQENIKCNILYHQYKRQGSLSGCTGYTLSDLERIKI